MNATTRNRKAFDMLLTLINLHDGTNDGGGGITEKDWNDARAIVAEVEATPAPEPIDSDTGHGEHPADTKPPLHKGGGFFTRGNAHIGYLMNFPGHGVFSTEGREDISPSEAETHNALLSTAEIEGLDRCEVWQWGTLYYTEGKGVKTFTGTMVSDNYAVSRGVIMFYRNGRKYRGKLTPDEDAFHFERIA